jgi:hypothetical protein
MDTSLEIGGLVVHAPVTAGTNLALAAQCLAYHRRLRGDAEARPRLWGAFFAMMAVATLAGVLKHGVPQELSASAFLGVLWISNVTGGASTWFAQLATIRSHAPDGDGRLLSRLVGAQLVLFLFANLAIGPAMLLLVVDTALGLLPVIVVETRARLLGRTEAGWVAAGLSVSIGTAVVYVTKLSAGPWRHGRERRRERRARRDRGAFRSLFALAGLCGTLLRCAVIARITHQRTTG